MTAIQPREASHGTALSHLRQRDDRTNPWGMDLPPLLGAPLDSLSTMEQNALLAATYTALRNALPDAVSHDHVVTVAGSVITEVSAAMVFALKDTDQMFAQAFSSEYRRILIRAIDQQLAQHNVTQRILRILERGGADADALGLTIPASI